MKCTKTSYMLLFSFVFITDVPRYRAFSPVFIYSVCLYVLVDIMSLLSTWDGSLNAYKNVDNFSSSVAHILVMVMSVNCLAAPVLAWIDTPKSVQYLHRWEQFQVGSK
jgi:hypothetical protein